MSAASRFSEDQARGLVALLDTLIPPCAERGLPGAGEVGLLAHLETNAPDLRPALREGLEALDARARERGAASFAALAPEDRTAALAAHAEADPGLVPALVFHVFTAYYQQQAVVEALGLEHRPPFPKGYELAPTDASLLDRMRERPPLYREV